MRVWTVHPRLVWERLQDTGTLYVEPVYFHEGYVPWQYEWLAHRLQERIPGYSGGLPWWAYCDKPDLRWVRHHLPVRKPQVRIELDLEGEFVFPSWAWNIVHSGHFLSFTKREQQTWETTMRKAVPDEDLWPLPEPWRSELEASWLRLFDPKLPAQGWLDVDNPPTPCKDAVFEILRMKDVRSVTHFVGNSRWSQ